MVEKSEIVEYVQNMKFPLSSVQEEKIIQFLMHFNNWNKVHNLTSVRSISAQVRELLYPSLQLFASVKSYTKLIDLGSGGGFPGIILAILDEEKSWKLVEKSQKKSNFLRFCKQTLSLSNIEVCQQDFLAMPVTDDVGAIVSRGSAKLERQVVWTKPWRDKGCVLISVQSEKSLHEAGVNESVESTILEGRVRSGTLRVVVVR